MIVRTKDAQGEAAFAEMDFDGLVKWMRGHTDKAGNVLDEIVLFADAGYTKQVGDGEFEWVMSDFSLDRDQEKIDPEGWDLREFKKNPVMLWSHNYTMPAIGRVKNPRVVRDASGTARLVGVCKFDPKEVDAFAYQIGEKVRIGTIKAGSVGFKPSKVELPGEDEDGKTPKAEKPRLIYRKQALWEFSPCNIPSNPNALVQDSAPAGLAWTHDGKGFRQRADERDESAFELWRRGKTIVQPPWPSKEDHDQMLASGKSTVDGLAEDRAAIPFRDMGTMPEGEMWDGPMQMRADVDVLKQICAWYDAENPDVKSSYKLPHHMAENKKAVWKGVSAAMGALMGGRGGVDIPEGDRRAVYNHLAKHYAQFDKEPPPFKSIDEIDAETEKALWQKAYESVSAELTKGFEAVLKRIDDLTKLTATAAKSGVPAPRRSPYLDDLLQSRKDERRQTPVEDLLSKRGGEQETKGGQP